jgi:hypothetical protein
MENKKIKNFNKINIPKIIVDKNSIIIIIVKKKEEIINLTRKTCTIIRMINLSKIKVTQ